MSRVISNLTVVLIVVFAAAILVIRLRPYQDAGLLAFLTPPPGCAAPCWLGVQPGVTSLDASNRILQHNAWIGQVNAVSPATAHLGFSPDVEAVQYARLNLWQDKTGLVRRLDLFETGLSFSDVLLVLGEPARLVLYQTIRYDTSELTAIYPDYSLYVTVTIVPCSLHQQTFWREADDATITIGQWQPKDKLYPDYYLSALELDRREWATQLRALRTCP